MPRENCVKWSPQLDEMFGLHFEFSAISIIVILLITERGALQFRVCVCVSTVD